MISVVCRVVYLLDDLATHIQQAQDTFYDLYLNTTAPKVRKCGPEVSAGFQSDIKTPEFRAPSATGPRRRHKTTKCTLFNTDAHINLQFVGKCWW